MKPEKQKLILDLMDRESGREAILLAGTRVLRRRRRWRYASRGLMFAAFVGVAILWIEHSIPHPSVVHQVTQVQPAPPASQPKALTDDELLALFPDTPVGLVTLADGQKRLIFPRPGDEARFITRL
jgi:hypothetical protein